MLFIHSSVFCILDLARDHIMTKYTFLFLAALTGFLPMIADAQVSEQDLVRVKIVDGRQVEGKVSGVMASGLVVRSFDGFSENISFDEVESLHLKTGPSTYALRGASLGAIIGAGVGRVMGYIMAASIIDSSFGIIFAPLGAIISLFPGALAGLIIGALFKRSDVWQEIPLMGMNSMSIEPRIGIRTDGYPALGVQLVF